MSTADQVARRARLPRDERRLQLLEAAQQVFVATGYHASARDNIAEAAGVSKPVLYQHFPSKLDLYLALLDISCDRLVAVVRNALASTSNNRDRVAAVVGAYFTFVDQEVGAFRLIFESDLTGEPAVRERVDRAEHACAEAIAEVIAEDTGLDHEAAMLLAVGLAGQAQVTARWWVAGDVGVSRDQAAELLSTLAWRGIRGFPRTPG